jgi:dihydropteroate synthase
MDTLLRLRNKDLPLDRTLIMGVLNVTPDSFSDGGRFFDVKSAVERAREMVEEGADIIDVGGESTRPGSVCVSLTEELKRVIPIVSALLKEITVPISIDTKKPKVAEACLDLGVHMLNDVTGLQDEGMVNVAARYRVPTVVMYPSGTAETVHQNPISEHTDIVEDIKQYLGARAARARRSGVDQVIIDPGIGFGKTLEQNLTVMNRLHEIASLGYPVLAGPSRKGFIGKILGTEVDSHTKRGHGALGAGIGEASPRCGVGVDDRLEGTLAAVTACVLNGANIIRVHDVRSCKRAAVMADAIKSENSKRETAT